MSREKKEVRQRFQTAVFTRDSHKCIFCDETEDLDAHHITDRHRMPGGGYIVENGITLCKHHHRQAEVYNETGGKEFIEGFHPEDLYKKISSSWREAMIVCKQDWAGNMGLGKHDDI